MNDKIEYFRSENRRLEELNRKNEPQFVAESKSKEVQDFSSQIKPFERPFLKTLKPFELDIEPKLKSRSPFEEFKNTQTKATIE